MYELSAGLISNMLSICNGFQEVNYKKITSLTVMIKSRLKDIRRQYKKITFNGVQNASDEWIYDNYYIIEKEAKTVIKSINNTSLPICSKTGLPQIYLFLREAVLDEEFEFTTNSVIELINLFEKKRNIKNFELDFLKQAIKAASIECVWKSLFETISNERKTAIIHKCIKTLINIDELDMETVIKTKNKLDIILSGDPACIYDTMNETTKSVYRYKLCRIALKRGIDENEAAAQYINECKNAVPENDNGGGTFVKEKHIGYHIYNDYKKYINKNKRSKYIAIQWITPALISFAFSFFLGNFLWILLLFFPIWEIVKPFLDYVCVYRTESEYAPRLELDGDIPEKGRTLVVISTLLPGVRELKKMRGKLEKLYYSNGKGEISFLILADLKQSKLPTAPEDESQIKACSVLISKMNKEFGNKFMLMVRKRAYSKTGDIYTGAGRKRGAITELVRMIKGENTDCHFTGDKDFLTGVKYILALDYDTKALMETASSLVGIALHPLNEPIINKEKNIVTQGYGIIAPKMVTDLESSLSTPFAKVMCGLSGITAYDAKCTDLYQDLFDEGIFSGKGLINVNAYYELLDKAFPEETVLSHDILEGGFLRTRFVSDVEFVDGFPLNATPYFKRLHRWIRGDFQNIPYLFPKFKTQDKTIKNPLSSVSKFKLFDNLRRGLNPFFELLCMTSVIFITENIAWMFALTAFWAVVSPFFFGLIRAVTSGGIYALSRKYYSNAMPQTISLLSQAFYQIILLPKYAYNAFDAAVRGVYRRFISRKKMLEWVTAAQTESSKNTVKDFIRTYWFPEAVGIAFMFSEYGYMRLFGMFFLFAMFTVLYSGQKYPRLSEKISMIAQDELISKAAAMWRFYCDYATKSENYLPPDNMQEVPVYKIAHRTSPTNIGLLLLAVLCARDFDFINTDEMFEKLNNILNTVEKLEKWNGNLYNWYDTKSLAILEPKYVSTVDSGNYACCLVALKEGLKEFSSENENIGDLISRIEFQIENTELWHFYDKNKKLFSIGYDVNTGKFSKSYYDMLMSEARMTSYFAIAKRQVPKKHWSALSRTPAKCNAFTGPVSWTGTAFEYFMPELLLHSAEGSLSYEGLKFSLYCQKQRAVNCNIPFGISESGFYAFDAELNYQYKAHGIQKNALKRGMNKEIVVSPYSSYLTLSHDFTGSFKNLNELKKIGAVGRYGHYEAVDYTKERIGINPFAIIKSYMAHHVGMSMVAINNALNCGIMQKRFSSDPYMESAGELLQEKIIEGTSLFEDVFKKEITHKVSRESGDEQTFNSSSPASPRVKLLFNGEITSIQTDTGAGHLMYQGKDLTRRSDDLLRRPSGIFAGVKIGNNIIPFTNAPNYCLSNTPSKSGDEKEIIFGSNYSSFLTRSGDYQTGMMIMLHQTLPCEQRQFVIRNNSSKRCGAEFIIYMEPVLSHSRDDFSHMAFSKLFVHIGYDSVTNVLYAKRNKRKNEKQIYMAVGFLENIRFDYETNREKILKRPEGMQSLFGCFEKHFSRGCGTPDPCIAIKIKTEIMSRSQKEYTLITAGGSTIQEAIDNIVKIRLEGVVKKAEAARSLIMHNSIEGRLSSAILPQILYGKNDSHTGAKAVEKNQLNVKHLWRYGISGDIPLILLEVDGENDTDRVKNYIICQSKLKLAGILFDLIFVYSEGAQYDQPVKNMIYRIVKESGGEHKVGMHGGIHLIDTAVCMEETVILLRALACYIAPKNMLSSTDVNAEYKPIIINKILPLKTKINGELNIGPGRFSDNSFYLDAEPVLPWCHILANPSFGTLVSDKCLGYTWAVNSRENKITPWYNDTMSDNRGEMLIAKYSNEYFDLINGSSPVFNPGYAKYDGTFKNINSNITVSVPKKGMYKYIDVEIENTTNEQITLEIAYYIEPVLGVNRENSKQISKKIENNVFYFRNPFNMAVKSNAGIAVLNDESSYSSDLRFCSDRMYFFSGRWDETPLIDRDICASIIVKFELPPKKREKISFILAFAASEYGVSELINIAKGKIKQKDEKASNKILIKTPDQSLNFMFNTWLPWQNKAGRIYGRTGFYQCGGAFGFRDQLQDSCASVLLDSEITKRQIIRACTSQFEQGDVLHWWHNLPKYGGGKKGVRTKYSDDLLWLPYTVCEYIEKTGDYEILDICVKYALAPELSDNEHEKYFEVSYTEFKDSVYNHCIKAVERAYRLGVHDLPLMGCGDWNDGYNRVGENGKGESVWLAEFLSIVLNKFSKIAAYKNDSEKENEFIQKAENLLKAIDEHCWDGNWYLRAFFDNGEKMGADGNFECSIDSLPQSFSVISGMPDFERVKKALYSAYNRLVDDKTGIIRLFDKPFDSSHQEPGYVKSYPSGVRENGGQYTHAAVWLAMAFLKWGEKEKGYELIRILNTAEKYKSKESGDKYKLEPYYLAGDIYTNPNAYGRGGWSIYTGAAGWYYRVILEYFLGISINSGKININPVIPDHWQGYQVDIDYYGTELKITVDNKNKNGKTRIWENNKTIENISIDQKKHIIKVEI